MTVSDVVYGTDLNQKTDKYHIASHCGSVIYANENSVVIGWGRPVFTEYDAANDTVTFELTGTRNPNYSSHEAFFSYRTYKSAE